MIVATLQGFFQSRWSGKFKVLSGILLGFVPVGGVFRLLLDARGHGQSDADRFSSLPKFAEDVAACIEWLEGQPQRWNGRLILLGHSVGAGAVLLAASRNQRADAVISISTFSHPRTTMQRYLYRFPAPVRALITHQVQQVIGHSLDDIAPLNTIGRIACPVLVAHGLADTIVPAEEARRIVAGGRSGLVELALIEGAGHDSVESLLASGGRLLEFLEQHGLYAIKRRSGDEDGEAIQACGNVA